MARRNPIRIRFPKGTDIDNAMRFFKAGVDISKKFDLPFFTNEMAKVRVDLFVSQRLLVKLEQVVPSFSSEEMDDSIVYINKYMNLLITMKEAVGSSKSSRNMEVLVDMYGYFLKNGYLTAKQIKYAKYIMGKAKSIRIPLDGIEMKAIDNNIVSFINPTHRKNAIPIEEVKVPEKIQEPQEMQFIPKKKDLSKVR